MKEILAILVLSAGRGNILISGKKSTDVQPALWEEPIRGHGHVRIVIGNLAEELTAQLVGGQRHKTDSRAWYCPDVSVGTTYYESKAVGLSGSVFIYEGRIGKDMEFIASIGAKRELYYVIWNHGASTKEAKTVEQLRRLVLDSLKAVYVVPFIEINRICAWLPLEKLNSGYGGTDRKTYGSGYRFKIDLLDRWKMLPYC